MKENVGHKHSRELMEYFHGALERYKQALFAKQLLGLLMEHQPDNDIIFLANFHFFYFITLIKTLGNNLAWLLNYFYPMELESSPSEIDLTKQSFRENLEHCCARLFKAICQGSEYENTYRPLRDFRDIVVHRHALHVVTVQFGLDGPKKIMVPVDPAAGTLVDIEERLRRGVRSVIISNKES